MSRRLACPASSPPSSRRTRLRCPSQPSPPPRALLVAVAAAGCGKGKATGSTDTTPTLSASACLPDLATFEARVWKPVLAYKCATCHSATGVAAGTRFVLATGDGADAAQANLTASARMALATEEGEPLLLRRPTGTHHVGGTVVQPGDADYQALADFVGRARGDATTCAAATRPPCGARTSSPSSRTPRRWACPTPRVGHAAAHVLARVVLQRAQQRQRGRRVVHQRREPQAPGQARAAAFADQAAHVRARVARPVGQRREGEGRVRHDEGPHRPLAGEALRQRVQAAQRALGRVQAAARDELGHRPDRPAGQACVAGAQLAEGLVAARRPRQVEGRLDLLARREPAAEVAGEVEGLELHRAPVELAARHLAQHREEPGAAQGGVVAALRVAGEAHAGVADVAADVPLGVGVHEQPAQRAVALALSARDLLALTRAFLAVPALRDLAARERVELSTQGGRRLSAATRNSLLGRVRGVTGVKTGTTDAAGRCVVARAERDGAEVVVVLLDAPDRWFTAAALLEAAFRERPRG